ncbi:GRP family sugar transporter [Ligilactobacillus faecis]|uniref:GRP family sugar transporter n=1 Tax=Ligilactobacillus faecis TaxID=762833 RepID=UPI0024682346|nr:GRP family sugar transporter [Ligilactobacillus faecis]WGN89662.1 GRP family sugar transporter [Ligilactobacillus faecis]
MWIALIPAIAWGSVGLISGKLGGNANQQTLGMTWGALLFALVTTLVSPGNFLAHNDMRLWIAGILSGLFWSLGQNQQFHAMKAVGISKAVPISTGAQLVTNALAGVILFHEWTTSHQLTLGTLALVILVVGATLTALRDKSAQTGGQSENWAKGTTALVLSTAGYLGYTVVVNFLKVDAQAMVLPQAIGMVAGASVFALGKDAFKKESFKNIVTGLVWGTGNLCMFQATAMIGLAVSFSLSQTGIVISTFGSILLLGEHKTKREMVYVTLGSLMVIIGGVMLGLLK